MLRVALVLAVLVTGCTEPRSTTCRAVCKREAECIEETGNKMPFETKECEAACAALERDEANNAAKVQRHIDCVNKQTACPAVLECK